MYGNTQDDESIDLKPATVNLVHDKSLGLICSLLSDESLYLFCPAYGPVYMQARLHPGLTENGRPRLLTEMLHAHQDAVRAHSLAKA